MIQIVAIRLGGVEHPQHITDLWWLLIEPGQVPSGTAQQITREGMVDFVRQNPGQAIVARADGQGGVALQVVEADPPYVRTTADETPSDNLLALQRW